MASVMGSLALLTLLLLAVPTTGSDCPLQCMCLGNIVDCTAKQISYLPLNISEYQWIEELQLSENPGLDLTGEQLSLLPRLAVLQLEKLGLTQVPRLGNLSHLIKLSLRGNELSSVDELGSLPSLQHLDLGRNALTRFPAHLSLPHLRRLNCDRNRMRGVEGSGEGLEALQELRLVRNEITGHALLSSALLTNLPALTSLNLHWNALGTLDSLIFQNCSALRHLKLSRNQLTILSHGVFFGLHNLKTLSLDQNNLTVVSNTWLFGLKSLEELSLRHNAIVSIVADAFHHMTPELLSLDLSYNELVSLHPSFLKGLEQLEYLHLAHNHLTTVISNTFTSTPNLLHLDVSFNDLRWTIEDSTSEAYKGLSNLQALDLSNNNIEAVQYAALAPITSIVKLDLGGNRIRTLHDNPFRNLRAVPGEDYPQLVLNTTSLVCDCHLNDWLWHWLTTTSPEVMRDVHAICRYPPTLAGTPLADVPPEPPLPCSTSPRPVILDSPQDRIVLKDNDVELQCSARVGSRGGDPRIMWRRDNQQVEPYKLNKTLKVEKPDPFGGVISRVTSVLMLTRVTNLDGGRYQCIVRNEHGVGYSRPAVIEVQIKPYFTVFPTSIHSKVDCTARIECAASGTPPPEISLQKGGSDDFPAARERRLLVDSKDTVFFIKPLMLVDEGVYTCTANSTAGTATASANITVSQSPFFLQPVHDATVRPGDTAVLHCQGSGRPLPSISWTRAGQPVIATTRHLRVDDGEFLIVMDVRSEDAGSYTCSLTNTYGVRSQTMHLTVFDGLLVDGETTLVLVMLAVVVCVVITSVVWVIIIYHTRRRRTLANNMLYPPNHFPPHSPSSSSSPQHHASFPHSSPHSPVPTDTLLARDYDTNAPCLPTGPDTGSEHSTGKDSGVGDSSQRSSEDLRQVASDKQATGRSALLLPDHTLLPAIVRGGSCLSVATDTDSRYDDTRPRLSTFGAGGSATLRRPSGHRAIAVAVPCVQGHHTATLPYRRSLRHERPRRAAQHPPITAGDAKRDPINIIEDVEQQQRLREQQQQQQRLLEQQQQLLQRELQQQHQLQQTDLDMPDTEHSDSDRQLYPYADAGPSSPPSILSTKRAPLATSDTTASTPQSSYGDTSDSCPSDRLLPSPQYHSSHYQAPNATEDLYQSRAQIAGGNRLNATEDLYQSRAQIVGGNILNKPMSSDYSTPSIIYSHRTGVHINGIRPGPPPPPPPPPVTHQHDLLHQLPAAPR